MKTKPQKQHKWLEKLVGEWEYQGQAQMGPGQPPTKWNGHESARSIGGL